MGQVPRGPITPSIAMIVRWAGRGRTRRRRSVLGQLIVGWKMSGGLAADMVTLDLVRDRLIGLDRQYTPSDVASAMRAEGLAVSDSAVLDAMESLRRNSVGAGLLEPLLREPGLTDVLVNGPDQVFIDRGAGLEQTDLRFRSESDVRRLAQRLAALVGRRLDDAVPFVGWEVVSVFRTRGGPATAARPGFEDMLTFLSKGDAQVLIARHHDRLTRNAEDVDRLMKICRKSKIKISTYTSGELDLSTASGGFYGFMEVGRSWYESAIRSQRVKDAMERVAREGKRTGGGSRPFGYKIIRQDLGEGAPRRWRIVGEELEPAEKS